MILRRPYAFLIKHFRLIHFIILGLMSYIFYKSIGIASFYSARAGREKFGDYEALANQYVNGPVILAFLALLAIVGILIYLLKYKNKPLKYYIITISSYAFIFAFFLFTKSYISDMNTNDLDINLIRIIRDIFMITTGLQVPLLIYTLVRGSGFNIKQFDFKNDIADMDISAEDSEEFEFQIGIDKNDLITKVRRKFRYFKYYYIENKTVFHIMYGIAGFILVISVINAVRSIEPTYKEGQTFDYGSVDITVLDSFKTFYSTVGERISDKAFFLVSKIRIKNKTGNGISFNNKLLQLNYTSTNSVQSTSKYNSKFLEFGVPYEDNVIPAYSEKDYIFIFEVPREYYKTKLNMKFKYSVDYKDGKYNYHYRTVKLKPAYDEDKSKIVDSKTLGEELVFKDSYFGNTKLTITEYQIASSFRYKLHKCVERKCSDQTYIVKAPTNTQFDLSLMRLKYNLVLDKEKLGSDYTIDSFIARFATVSFVINGKTYNNRLVLKDESPYASNNYSFIQIRSRAMEAEKVTLKFNIRNKAYEYVIYDRTEESINPA